MRARVTLHDRLVLDVAATTNEGTEARHLISCGGQCTSAVAHSWSRLSFSCAVFAEQEGAGQNANGKESRAYQSL